MLDLGSEAERVLIPLRVIFCHLIFFHVVKPLMPILSLLSMLSIYEKHDCDYAILPRWVLSASNEH